MAHEIFHSARLIAIVRTKADVDLVELCQALYAGGVEAVEITLNTPGALDAIRQLGTRLPAGRTIGAGTVVTAIDARRAQDAGAQFLVAPTLEPETITFAQEAGLPICAGAYTPTEALAAYRMGADRVKIFPCDQLGPGYIKNLLSPLPDLPLMPTGGVTLDNLDEWFAAGATAVGVGSALLDLKHVQDADWAAIEKTAQTWMRNLKLLISPNPEPNFYRPNDTTFR